LSRLGQSRCLRDWLFFVSHRNLDFMKEVMMALKVDLKPGERIVIGEAVVQNGVAVGAFQHVVVAACRGLAAW